MSVGPAEADVEPVSVGDTEKDAVPVALLLAVEDAEAVADADAELEAVALPGAVGEAEGVPEREGTNVAVLDTVADHVSAVFVGAPEGVPVAVALAVFEGEYVNSGALSSAPKKTSSSAMSLPYESGCAFVSRISTVPMLGGDQLADERCQSGQSRPSVW